MQMRMPEEPDYLHIDILSALDSDDMIYLVGIAIIAA